MKNLEDSVRFILILAQLFNDERDVQTHISQLKTKYGNMRKLMENKLVELNDKRRIVIGDNVSLKSKYEIISKSEKEVYDKLMSMTESSNNKLNIIGSEYTSKNKERNEIDALLRATQYEIKTETDNNKKLELELLNTQKMEEMKQKDYENSLMLRENINKFKQDEYIDVDKRIRDLNNSSSEDPVVKIEFEKNKENKKKIEAIEKELIMSEFRVEELEIQNDYLVKKKEDMIQERKKFIMLNDELKREIEQKSQLNEMRITKKVKENNSEEIIKMEENLKELIVKGDEFEKKIQVEYDKAKIFATEIIKLNIEIKHREQKKERLLEIIDEKYKEMDELKEKVDELREGYVGVTDRLNKAKTENEILRNRNVLLMQEHSSIESKLEYVLKNYDVTSNLKKISIDDLKVLTQTNNQVNETVNHFVNKVGTFKSNQIPTNILEEY